MCSRQIWAQALPCTLSSMLTAPQQPSVPQLTLTPDWHPRSYITSSNSPATASAAELSAEKKLLSPNKAKTPHLSATLICFEFLFLSFYIDTKHDPGRLNDLQRREEKSVARRLCLYRLRVPLKGSYGWQEEEEERGERMWGGQ